MGVRVPNHSANKLTKAQGGANLKSVLRHEHLKNLALWSTGGGDTPIPSLAAFFGRRLAADGKASHIPHDPDLFSCQRCETILQPGFNCTVRIEKLSANKKKHMRRYKKKPNMFLSQNNVVYYCKFCSHRNLKRGTTKGQMKDMYPPKPKTTTRPRSKIFDKEEMMVVVVPQEIQTPSSPERRRCENNDQVENTPKPMLTLEREKRIRKSKSKKPIEPESVPEEKAAVGGGSNKRKRKAWTNMKELSSETTTNKTSSRAVNFKIPFQL